jgi:hypothetical protein
MAGVGHARPGHPRLQREQEESVKAAPNAAMTRFLQGLSGGRKSAEAVSAAMFFRLTIAIALALPAQRPHNRQVFRLRLIYARRNKRVTQTIGVR